MLSKSLALFFVLHICLVSSVKYVPNEVLSNRTFPKDFMFGCVTAAYQIEGAWDEDGKGESVWDHLIHTHPEKVEDGTNGDVTCDSYHKYLEDVQSFKELDVDFYRFSIAWSRIYPKGLPNQLNQKGVDYYNNLIDVLLDEGIEPVVTIYHWDHPQYLEDLGGFLNDQMIEYYRAFADTVFEIFGDRVKYWITFNEPHQTCLGAYGGEWNAPGLGISGIADYQCSYNLLKAHAAAWHLYDEKYRNKYNGLVAITFDSNFVFTKDDDPKDVEAQERELEFGLGWFANPVFGENGNYPQVMIDRIANRSKLEGFLPSRLPEFTQEEINYIKGTADFFGINHYSSEMIEDVADNPIGEPNYYSDKGGYTYTNDEWEPSISTILHRVPEGFRALLNRIKNKYGNPKIFVTENGFPNGGGLEDPDRIKYYKTYLSALLDAIFEDEVNVIGYAAWSVFDNFEWLSGYVYKFGLYEVDFEDPERRRTAKQSATYYKQVINTRCVLEQEDGVCEEN